MNQKPIDIKSHKKVFKAASLMGTSSGMPTTVESDKDGKITRIRPYHYEEHNDWDSLNPWKIEARGREFQA
ncbi:MAG: hypothetical protein GX248_01850, partial [Peptococcaceae bacterium]|nr:hypothetical protein [Peptococcaceae bacterium]